MRQLLAIAALLVAPLSLLGQVAISSGNISNVTTNFTGQVANSATYAVDPTGVADSTTAIQSMLNAAGIFTETNPYLANASVTAVGGGVVHLKQGFYKVTATLTYSGQVTFEGEGDGTVIEFCPTAANSDLFAPSSNYSWNGQMESPKFRKFFAYVPSSCGTASDVRYAFNMTGAQRSIIDTTRLGSGFTYDAYYANGSGGGYYNTIRDPWWFGATTAAVYAGTGANSINIFGGDLRDISGLNSKTYEVINYGQGMSIFGTALEGNVTKAQVDCEAPTALYGGYTQGYVDAVSSPIMDVNAAIANRLTGGCTMQGYLGGAIMVHNAQQTAQVPSADDAVTVQPMSLNIGNPVSITSQIITNNSMVTASSGWTTTTGLGTNGTCAQAASGTGLTGFSLYSYVMTNNGSGALSCGQTTAYTALAPYTGGDIYIGIWIKSDGNTQSFYLDTYGACGSYGSGTGCSSSVVATPSVTRDDGWALYVADVGIVSATSSAQALTWAIVQTGAANATKLYIGGAEAWVGGYEVFPVSH